MMFALVAEVPMPSSPLNIFLRLASVESQEISIEANIQTVECPACDKDMFLRQGKKGQFFHRFNQCTFVVSCGWLCLLGLNIHCINS
jgi:ssDNA-binding Zn-finger/Zn-ribbon topoisomerase 1